MAVNKNFVVKNGLEVNTSLIVANAETQRVGIASTTPQRTLDVSGGIGATDLYITGFTTIFKDLRVGASGTTLTVINDFVGVGTDIPSFPLDIRQSVSVGQTALYVHGDATITGDLNVTGDITYDEVSGRNLNITGVGTVARLNTTSLVGTAATFTVLNTTGIGTVGILSATHAVVSGAATVVGSLTVGGDLNVTGDLSYDEVTGRNINITGVGTITRLNTTDIVSTSSTITRLTNTDFVGTSATITRLNATNAVISGVMTATSFTGVGQVGVASDGTFLGAGASMLNFTSTTGTAIAVNPAETSGIATITITPGVTLGLAIALGG